MANSADLDQTSQILVYTVCSDVSVQKFSNITVTIFVLILPFISGHPRIQPKSFVKPDIFEHFAKDYMLLGCIKFINQVRY